ncbi:hypothetical protein KEM48_009877 [Puccinia striiformis f. sp. tritici PST-130]|nr:hypothetical protein KEM48_009877 [Puccinia striiformis f. sp. tritici PST-130]
MLSELPPAYSSQGVEAIFQLEHIILAGHAREVPSDIPPRGLQIVLSDLLRNQEVDTIIMANFLCLTTFNGLTIYPRVRKRPDKISESLIQPLSASSTSSKKSPVGEFSKLMGQVKDLASGMLRGQGSDLANGTSRSVINVFTVASGLLYERMAYLMCSGSTDLERLIKFLVWFISNFLSPSFKRFIPHLAKEYGFDYQLVTYRWPSWLRAQKEKQRVIWGSSYLCRLRSGIPIWDTGYWKESLQGRPYHISALYVVDLRVFRTIAAGDQLRQHYQSLSADPGSLANLDQDLPNNMQSILPIVLKRARRLIPEWDTYDQEVACSLASRIKKNLNEDDSSAKITVQAGLKIDDEDLNHSVHQKDDQSSLF